MEKLLSDVTVKLTPEKRRLLSQIADRAGVSDSEYMRTLLDKDIENLRDEMLSLVSNFAQDAETLKQRHDGTTGDV